MADKIKTLLKAGVYIKSIVEDFNIPVNQAQQMLDMFITIINFDQSVRSENTLAGLKIAGLKAGLAEEER